MHIELLVVLSLCTEVYGVPMALPFPCVRGWADWYAYILLLAGSVLEASWDDSYTKLIYIE